jgi:hypothetical protein
MLFSFSIEYAISKSHENQEGLVLNETHQLLVSADDDNILIENIKVLSEVSREVGLEVNTERTKYMVMFHH